MFTEPAFSISSGEPFGFVSQQDRLFFIMRALRSDGSSNGTEWWSIPAPAPPDPFRAWLAQYGLQGADPFIEGGKMKIERAVGSFGSRGLRTV